MGHMLRSIDPLVWSALALVITSALSLIVLQMALEGEVSERARQLLEDVFEAMRQRGQLKMTAADLGVTQETLSRWRNPEKPSQLTRLADLGDDFERRLIEVRAKRVGLRVVDARLARLLDALDAQEKTA